MAKKIRTFQRTEELEMAVFIDCILKCGGSCNVEAIYRHGEFMGAVVQYATKD